MELIGHLLYTQALACQQYGEVIQQIACLVDKVLIGTVGGLDNCFESLLANLLGYLVDTILEEFGGVAALGHLLVAHIDKVLQLCKECHSAIVLLAPAGVGTSVACWAIGGCLYKQSIVVAINHNVNQMQEVSAGLAFGPKAVTTATPEGYLARLDGLIVGLLIHVAKHQYVLGLGILYDSGNKSTAFFKINFHFYIYYLLRILRIIRIIYILTFMPSSFR